MSGPQPGLQQQLHHRTVRLTLKNMGTWSPYHTHAKQVTQTYPEHTLHLPFFHKPSFHPWSL